MVAGEGEEVRPHLHERPAQLAALGEVQLDDPLRPGHPDLGGARREGGVAAGAGGHPRRDIQVECPGPRVHGLGALQRRRRVGEVALDEAAGCVGEHLQHRVAAGDAVEQPPARLGIARGPEVPGLDGDVEPERAALAGPDPVGHGEPERAVLAAAVEAALVGEHLGQSSACALTTTSCRNSVGPPGRGAGAAVSSDRLTSIASRSAVSSTGSPTVAAAARRPNGPDSAASRRCTSCSVGVSRRCPQSNADCRDCRRSVLGRPIRASRTGSARTWSRISSSPYTRARAAASSMASGRPSRSEQISAARWRTSPVTASPGTAVRSRATNRSPPAASSGATG